MLLGFRKMKNAYGMLYEIETELRQQIIKRMLDKYGENWERVAPLKENRSPLLRNYANLNLYELEHFLYYSVFDDIRDIPFYKKFLHALHTTYPLRNKIAHCHELTECEYHTLEKNYLIIMHILKERHSLLFSHKTVRETLF